MTPTLLKHDIFISYARKDGEDHAKKLEYALEQAGYSTWRDKRGIDPSQDFTAEIENAIQAARYVVICVTKDVERENSFVRREANRALRKEKPVIVARFEEADPPISLENHTPLNFFKLGWNEGISQLKGWLTRFATGLYLAPPPPAVLAADPYRDYLGDLDDAIVSYLDQTVIRLIEVTGKATPDAVPRRPLLASFKARAGIHDAGQSVVSVSEGMAKYKGRVLLLGEPGAGKTTALMSYARQRVSDRLNDPTQPLPILLRCAEWESSPPLPLDSWMAKATGLTLAGQSVLLLLDGLDELGSSRTEKIKEFDREVEHSYDPRKRFLDQLMPTSGQVLLSCRVQDYADIHEQAKLGGAVTLQPLTNEQIQDYLHDLPDLWTALQADTGLLEIARTPLLLSFFAYGFKDAPQEAQALRDLSKAQLGDKIFERYVHERYAHEERRLSDIGEMPSFVLDEIYEVLGHVAMINASGGWRQDSRILDSWREIQDNILLERDFSEKLHQDYIKSFIAFSVNLNLLSQLEDRIGFVHLRLRDHLVRKYCLPRIEDVDLYIQDYVPNPAVALGSLPDGESVIVLSDLLDSENSLFSDSAAIGLGKTKHFSAVTPLINSLYIYGNFTAVESLGEIGGELAIKGLIARFQDEYEDELVCSSIASVLGNIGGEVALEALISSLKINKPDNIWVQGAVVEALGNIGNTRSIPVLIEKLKDVRKWDTDIHICDLAAKALDKIGTHEALEAIVEWQVPLFDEDSDMYDGNEF